MAMRASVATSAVMNGGSLTTSRWTLTTEAVMPTAPAAASPQARPAFDPSRSTMTAHVMAADVATTKRALVIGEKPARNGAAMAIGNPGGQWSSGDVLSALT